jgi:hypothetical protein
MSFIVAGVEWMTRLAEPLGVLPGDLVPWDKGQAPEPSGEYRWAEDTAAINVNTLRRAMADVFDVLKATMEHVPEARWDAPWMPDLLSALAWHSLQGFALIPVETEAFIWTLCGHPERGEEMKRLFAAEVAKERDRLIQEASEKEREAKGLEKFRSTVKAVMEDARLNLTT